MYRILAGPPQHEPLLTPLGWVLLICAVVGAILLWRLMK